MNAVSCNSVRIKKIKYLKSTKYVKYLQKFSRFHENKNSFYNSKSDLDVTEHIKMVQ